MIDRTVRIVVGVALLIAAFVLAPPYKYFFLIGIVPLFTGIIGFCPLYTVLKIDTTRK